MTIWEKSISISGESKCENLDIQAELTHLSTGKEASLSGAKWMRGRSRRGGWEEDATEWLQACGPLEGLWLLFSRRFWARKWNSLTLLAAFLRIDHLGWSLGMGRARAEAGPLTRWELPDESEIWGITLGRDSENYLVVTLQRTRDSTYVSL